MSTTKDSKRILSVTVSRIADYDADTRDLGVFSDTPEAYAIVHQGEYAGRFADTLPCGCDHPDMRHYEDGDDAGKCMDCDCEEFDRVEVSGDSRVFKYFNGPVENYEGEDAADIRKYCQQDYERMKGLDSGEWNYIGIKAKAQVQLTGDLVQTLTSGGIWGIESDGDPSDFRSIESEQTDELKAELHAIGFSKRAIAAAFRNVEHKDA